MLRTTISGGTPTLNLTKGSTLIWSLRSTLNCNAFGHVPTWQNWAGPWPHRFGFCNFRGPILTHPCRRPGSNHWCLVMDVHKKAARKRWWTKSKKTIQYRVGFFKQVKIAQSIVTPCYYWIAVETGWFRQSKRPSTLGAQLLCFPHPCRACRCSGTPQWYGNDGATLRRSNTPPPALCGSVERRVVHPASPKWPVCEPDDEGRWPKISGLAWIIA